MPISRICGADGGSMFPVGSKRSLTEIFRYSDEMRSQYSLVLFPSNRAHAAVPQAGFEGDAERLEGANAPSITTGHGERC